MRTGTFSCQAAEGLPNAMGRTPPFFLLSAIRLAQKKVESMKEYFPLKYGG